MININWHETLINTMVIVLQLFGPYIWAIVIMAFILWIAKRYFGDFAYRFSRLTGYSHREAKKRERTTHDLLDLLSSFWDIFRK